ncbi:hypothetical protein [Bifidobacterium thermophilum]|uniref:Uncharacterized protein n=1 Tax=Bifidobacterium thermophilum TaxID=33905 RepID=A0A7X9NQT6_9BIFI|nr:hypothetical protein [Bifidobacterium thermophilum]NME61852.1 hypothetical protein [Bifidobacterium thermophilum]
MAVNVTEKDRTLRQVILWCEREAGLQADVYRGSYGEERVRADAAGDAYARVAAHCRGMLGYGGRMCAADAYDPVTDTESNLEAADG